MRHLSLLALATALVSCRSLAQTPLATPAAQHAPLSLEMKRRVEVQIREHANLPPEATVQVSERTPSEVYGFDTVTVTIETAGKSSKPVSFLLSTDGKTLAQFTKFDLSSDPRMLVNIDGWPSRGGPANAPVLIVSFDDLECPFCAQMHAQLYAGVSSRYGDQVRLVYVPIPSDEHPWAMRAAVDVSCMLPESPAGYWTLVDYFHAHAGEMGIVPTQGPRVDQSVKRDIKVALEQVDEATRKQGEVQKLDMMKVNACIARQDTSAIVASEKMGTNLNVEQTPSLFINGAKVVGAVSMNFLYGVIDEALLAQGIAPPASAAPKP